MSWGNYGYGQFAPYVSVAARRAKAAKHAQKLAKAGAKLSPIKIEGRKIARTFWGNAWCTHLESVSDYENRLPRGRSYVRNGSVMDVQLAPGKVTAMVMGSSLYHGTITIAPLKPAKWKAIKAECAGKIDSLVGLLQGRLSDAVMRSSPTGIKGFSLYRRKSSWGAAVRIPPACANIWRRCFMESARDSTRNRSCFSCCEAWITWNSSVPLRMRQRWLRRTRVR